MLRRFAPIAGLLVGTVALATGGPAFATPTQAASGDATSVTASSADLNGVVYRDRVGARWQFEYSLSPTFDTAVLVTPPVLSSGRLSAVERQVTGLTPLTTYYWRVVLSTRAGTGTQQTFGAIRSLTTLAAPSP